MMRGKRRQAAAGQSGDTGVPGAAAALEWRGAALQGDALCYGFSFWQLNISTWRRNMNTRRLMLLVCSLLLFVCAAAAQDRVRIINASASTNQSIVRKITDPTYIPAGSRVYVANISGMPGFENNLVAAFQKKRVDLLVVADRSQADFETMGLQNLKRPDGPRLSLAVVFPNRKRVSN
jgi:hypothetical protein